MMSWLAWMMPRNPFMFGPRTLARLPAVRMWNDTGRPRSTTASQNAVVHRRRRSPRRRGDAGQHDAAQAERLDRSRSAMPSSGVRIAVWPSPSSRSGASEQNSAIQRLYASKQALLVVEVGVVAEHHPDRRDRSPRRRRRRGAVRRPGRRGRTHRGAAHPRTTPPPRRRACARPRRCGQTGPGSGRARRGR